MAYVIALVSACVCLVVLYKLVAWRDLHAKSASNDCQLPASYRHLDLIFGLDDAVVDFNAIRTHNYARALKSHMDTYGLTYVTKGFSSYKWLNSAVPENLQTVFALKANDWGVAPSRQVPMEPFLGLGFLNCDGADWDKSRRLVKASLQKEVVNDLEALERLSDEVLRQLPNDGSTVDLQLVFEKMFLDNSTLFLFGESMGAVSGQTTGEAEDFIASFKAGLLGCGIRIIFGPLMSLFPTRNWLKACARTHALADKYTDRVMTHRSEQMSTDDKAGKKASTDRLRRTLLYHMVDQTTDRSFIRGTILQSLAATMDSNAIVLTNIFWLLARHLEILAELRTEVLSTAAAHNNEWNPHLLGQLTGVRNVINEAMRLYPVIPAINRIALVDTILPVGGGKDGTAPVFVPKGTSFRAHWHYLHRLPEIWGEDANIFRPDRWNLIKPTPWQFMPFGGGPRRCLGQEKAMLETTYIVARFLTAFQRVEARDERDWREKFAMSAKNLYGCHVALFAA